MTYPPLWRVVGSVISIFWLQDVHHTHNCRLYVLFWDIVFYLQKLRIGKIWPGQRHGTHEIIANFEQSYAKN